jgi:hypothetical protein
MWQYNRIFFGALMVSFSGSLPVGTLNVSVANLFIHQGLSATVQFAAAAVLAEILVVRIALVVARRLDYLSRFFNMVSVLVIFLLAFISLKAAFEMAPSGTVLPFTGQWPFLAGFFISIINPLHLPFWMGWTVALRSKQVLQDSTAAYNVYVGAIGIGTALAFALYALAGNVLIDVLKAQQHLLNWLIGIALLITGLIQVYKLR